MLKKLVFCACLLVLAGCSANQRTAPVSFGSVTGVATTGNLRLVTERSRPGYPPVVCSEPSPDYAVAFGSDSKADVKVDPASTTTAGVTSSGPGGQATLSITTKEDVKEGRGRAAAVLALRDGLYAACQSYANGVIGHDAYAVILSQYGHLLVALVGGGVAEDNKNNAVAASVADAKQETMSALLVACVSHHDLTRTPPVTRSDLLTPTFCRNVLARALTVATVK